MKPFSLLILLPLFVLSCSDSQGEEVNSGTNEAQQTDTITQVSDTTKTEGIQESDRMQNESDLILGQAEGDLDNDGIDEKVVVFARDLEIESSSPRDLVIYKNKNGVWENWIETENAVYSADEGGMMGDPFDGVSIKDGVLLIDHWGGSSWKWSNTDKYRYQEGDFYLIGFTSTYGRPCDYWEDYDYNLSTGACEFSFEPEICEDYEPETDYGPSWTEKFSYKIDALPKLTNRRQFSLQFESPKGKTFYL